jgi:hypothetical protein
MKKKIHTVRTVLKSNPTIVEIEVK